MIIIQLHNIKIQVTQLAMVETADSKGNPISSLSFQPVGGKQRTVELHKGLEIQIT